MRRVVVTGLGMVTPAGNCVRDAWRAALTGRSAVARISLFDASELPVQIAAEVRGFEPAQFLSAKEARQSSRFVQFTAGAAQEAIADSGLDVSRPSPRYGCAIGVGLGAFGDIEAESIAFAKNGPRRVSPLLLPYAIPNMAAGFASITHRFKGPNFCTATACASGAHAIGEAMLHIKVGSAEVMLAGGAEAAISPLSVACFARMRALSARNDAPAAASRPFDLNRDGFVMGEGAAALVLEEYEHARRRGARIYAELSGYGLTGDAFHITMPSPEGEGAARSMAMAMAMAQVNPDDVEYINAHGTSTSANDAVESAAIEMVFGEHAKRLTVSSTKGVTGHCLGAAGAIEAVFTVLSVHHGVAPPTANYETPDPACRLDYVPGEARSLAIRCALSNSFGFGGQNACLALQRLA